jgi:prevent-host-death family protein
MAVNVIPITDFRKRARDILAKLKNDPVVLTQRSRPTAVLVDYETYNEREQRLEELEQALDSLMLSRAIDTAEEFVSIDELFADVDSA